MSKKINHWCIICGKGYHACDSCDEIKSFTPWRALADTVEHYKIYFILKQFDNGMMSKDEAKVMLSQVDLSGMEDFKDSAKRALTEVLKEDAPSRKPSKKKTVEEIACDEPVATENNTEE